MEFVLGDLIWIYPHDELSWCPGTIAKVEDDSYLVTSAQGDDDSVYRVNKPDALPVHPSCLSKESDLLSLGEFNEGALLHTIRERYLENEIYTSVGTPILLSLNPYQKLQIYSSKTAENFRKTKTGKPHLFLMAEKAYSALREGNQSIIISGESGAGKTEAAKIILSYLAGSSSDSKSDLAKQVLDSNPILEAFGNAKTLRNDNSSRFGKFIEIHFDSVGLKLLSARIQNYLLEKSRIVGQQEGERNYHFFYQLCAGASDEEREQYGITDASDYYYLNQSDCFNIDDVDDSQNYSQTRQCMKVLGFTDQEQSEILSIIMSILHLGNLKFTGQDSSKIDPSTYPSLELASKLLGISSESLTKVLTTRVIIDPTNDQEIIMRQSLSQAAYTRDATSKAIYGKLFNWLVERINQTIFIQQKKPSKVIGLLDIYGFEVFDSNSFEQFCINYANEKLQQHFNHHMFKSEQAEYSKEKIKWEHIKYDDNQECIDLIEKSPLGIITLLDEQCKLPKGTDKQFLFNVSSKLTGNNKLCNPGQFASEYFGVGHYAGNVFYNVNGFLEKNKDSLNPQLASALENSSVKLVKTLFVSVKDKKKSNAPGSLSALTLATQFKSQLQELIKALSGSTPTYIRCIKPNSQKLPKVIDSKDVQRQLRCAGMLECIRIRKAGYSVRRTVKEFVEKYSIIVPNFSKKDLNWSNLGKHLYEELRKVKKLKEILHPEKKLIQIGLTMVFMKDEVRQSLDKQYSKKASKFAIRIQKFIRMFRARRHYKLLQSSTKFLQKHIKDWLFSLKATRQLKLFKSLISTLSSKFLVKLKSNSLSTIKKFLQIASSKSYLSFFKPDRNRFRSSSFNKEENSRFSISSNFSSSKGKKQEISKELSQGQSSVIDTVQREVKTLSYLLQREKEKTRSVQEEANYYKELYNSTLAKLELAEREKTPKIDEEIGKNEEKLKKETKNLKKQLKEKNNEISMIQLKLESLKTNQLELEEVNKELKDKQGVWEQKLYSEMRKNALEVQELRCKIPQVDSEKVKSEKIVLEKEIRALKASLRQCENENSSLKSDLSESEMKIQDFQESEARLKDQIKSLQSQITSHSSSFSSFKEDSNSALLRKLSDLQKDYQKLKDDLEDSHDENENLQVELQKLHLSQEHFKQELSKNQKMNKEKNIKIKELENEVEALHHEKLELTRAKIELQTLKQKPSQDSENLQEMKLQIEELNQEIDDLIKELAAAKQIHGTLLTLVKIKNNELEVLKQSGNSDLMADLEYQEQGLLQELERQTRNLNNFSDDDD